MLIYDSAQFGVWPTSRSEERPFSQDTAIISQICVISRSESFHSNKHAFCMSLGEQPLQILAQSSQRSSICAQGHAIPSVRATRPQIPVALLSAQEPTRSEQQDSACS